MAEQGFEEQSASYRIIEQAANAAGDAEKRASYGAEWTAGIKFATGIASMLTGTGEITDLLGGRGGAQLGGMVGMTPGEGGGFLGGFGGAG